MSQWAFFFKQFDILSKSEMVLLIILKMALFYSGVPVSHDSEPSNRSSKIEFSHNDCIIIWFNLIFTAVFTVVVLWAFINKKHLFTFSQAYLKIDR